MRATCGIVFSGNKNKKLCPLSHFSQAGDRSTKEWSAWRQLPQDTKCVGPLEGHHEHCLSWPDLFCMPLNLLTLDIQLPLKPSHPCRQRSYHPLFSHMFPFAQHPQRIRLRQQLEIRCNCISRQAYAELSLGPHGGTVKEWLGHSQHSHLVSGPHSFSLTLE